MNLNYIIKNMNRQIKPLCKQYAPSTMGNTGQNYYYYF